MEGVIAKEWGELQDAHYRRGDSRRSGRRWATNLILQLWSCGFAMWEHRNHILHSASSTENLQLERATNRRITREYAKGTAMLKQAAQRHFTSPLHQVLGKDINEKLKWLEAVQLERRTYKAQRKHLRENRRKFDQYFDRVPHPD